MYNRALGIVALLMLLAGCASTPPLGADARDRLGEVWINPVVETPKDMYYLGPGSGFGMMFGAIGGAIVGAANIAPGERLRQFAAAHDIHIDQIVKEEATKAFQDSGKLKLADAPRAGVATLKITVPMYGFTIPTGFNSDLVPIVSIKCTLTDSTGKVIWSANEATQALGNPAPGKTPDELRENPKLIEELWRTAAKSVMKDIVSHM